jgi:hypothetical protein
VQFVEFLRQCDELRLEGLGHNLAILRALEDPFDYMELEVLSPGSSVNKSSLLRRCSVGLWIKDGKGEGG